MMRTDLWPATLTWALTVLLLMVVPLLNGYPLVFSDTGTYLRTAFEGYVPPDRPIWYGVFIRYTSLNRATLWGPVIAQCALTALVVTRLLRASPAPVHRAWRSGLLAGGLVMLTGISWYAGQLMPDIFTGIGIGSLVLMLDGRTGRVERWAWSAVLLLCLFLHAGNAPILLLTALGLLPFVLRSGQGGSALSAWTITLVLSGWWLSHAATRLVTGEPAARPAQVFLMGRLVDSGVLEPLLRERCPGSGWELCGWRDRLPADSQDFLWSPESPLYAMGGWEATRQEYRAIVRDALTTPEHLLRFLGNTLRNTGRQLGDWHMGNGLLGTWYASPDSPPHHQVAKHLPHELAAYRASVMNTDETRARKVLHLADLLLRLGGLLALAALAVVLIRRDRSTPLPLPILIVLVALLANALVCAGVSTVADRFQTRMGWVVPLVLWPLALEQLRPTRHAH